MFEEIKKYLDQMGVDYSTDNEAIQALERPGAETIYIESMMTAIITTPGEEDYGQLLELEGWKVIMIQDDSEIQDKLRNINDRENSITTS